MSRRNISQPSADFAGGSYVCSRVMTKNPVTVEPGDSLARADARMKAGGFRRLPVVHEGKLIGILSEYDMRPYLESLDTHCGAGGDDA